MKKYILVIISLCILSLLGCDEMDIMNPELENILSAKETIHTPETIEQLVNGIRANVYGNHVWHTGFPGFMSGCIKKTKEGSRNAVYYIEKEENAPSLNKMDRIFGDQWDANYKVIAGVNLVFEAIKSVDEADFTERSKSEILGELYFFRGWAHYNVFKYFGHWWVENENILPDVARDKYRDYGIIYRNEIITVDNIHLKQLPVKDSYDRIHADLDEAIKLLGKFEDPRYPSNIAARGLKARLALMQGDYATAKQLATEVIGNPERSLEAGFIDVFENKENGSEIIFCRSIEPNEISVYQGYYGIAYGLDRGGWGPTDYYKELVDEDPRKEDIWQVGDNDWDVFIKLLPKDDRSAPLYFMRLSEMYLIKAEAELYGTGDALATITDFMLQKGIETTESNAEKLIFEEWIKEMTCENAHEWFAAVRFNKLFEINPVLVDIYDNQTVVVKFATRIDDQEMNANTELMQNPGYNQ